MLINLNFIKHHNLVKNSIKVWYNNKDLNIICLQQYDSKIIQDNTFQQQQQKQMHSSYSDIS